MNEQIQQKESEGQGMFYIEKDDEIAAQLIYSIQDNGIMNLDHTETIREMKGKGLAGKLMKHVVEYAREENVKLDPLCEYASVQFERHPEYQDVQLKK